MLPGLDETLSNSLQIIRFQLNNKGQLLINSFIEFDIDSSFLSEQKVLYLGCIRDRKVRLLYSHFQANPNLKNRLDNYSTTELELKCQTGDMYGHNEMQIFESYVKNDSVLFFIGFITPYNINFVKEEIASSLRNYTTLTFLHDTMMEKNVVWIIIIIFILVIATLSILLARFVSSGVSEPIRTLTEGMKKIGEGDLNYRVIVKAKDEIAYLVDSFNKMVQELKISRENLQRAERAAAWRDVARQISHEIKNPLTPIEFSIYRIESSLPKEWLNHTDLCESLRIIKEEIASIRRIATEFSQFARMPHLELKDGNIGDIVSSSVKLFREQEQGINIRLTIEKNLPLLPLDEQQFKSVIHNLLKNAIEASDENGIIDVKVDRSERGVRVEITDYGKGMDEDTKKRIFEPYFTTKKTGSGIGLFLSHRIITDHGGRIDVKTKEGQGTTFSIIF